MTRRSYPNPPIVEAVIDLRFVADVSGEALLAALGTALADRYPAERRRQDRLELSAALLPDAVSTTARRSPHVTFLRSNDGARLIGCGSRMMSVHALAPYPGWESS